MSEISSLHHISLPRHIDMRTRQDIQLIGFSDASGKGDAGTVYLRIVQNSGDIRVYFLTCKTKVAPLKTGQSDATIFITRLELCGTLLLTQTLHRVYNCLNSELSISTIRAWTDSTVVLS